MLQRLSDWVHVNVTENSRHAASWGMHPADEDV